MSILVWDTACQGAAGTGKPEGKTRQKPRVTAREEDHMPTTPKEEEQTRSAGQLIVQWSPVYSVKAGSYNTRHSIPSIPATLLRHGPKPRPELKFSSLANGWSSHGQEPQMWLVRAIRVFGAVRALKAPCISPICIVVSVEAWKEHVLVQFLIQKIKEPWAWGLSWFMPFQQLSHDHYFWDISIKNPYFLLDAFAAPNFTNEEAKKLMQYLKDGNI